MFERVAGIDPNWFGMLAGAALALVVASIVAAIAAWLAGFAMEIVVRGHPHGERKRILRRPIRVIRIVVFLLVALLMALPSLRLGGIVSRIGPQPEALVDWIFSSGLRIVFIVLLAYLFIWMAATITRHLEDELAGSVTVRQEERLKRVRTVGSLLRNVFGVVVAAIALLMILRELNMDITPILTGAGIVGLAIGFGAQTLVKDIITGFFMILENQIRVGDVVVINGTSGLVESIQLRTISLRDAEGAVHIFPNGSIARLANQTKDHAYAVLDVVVAYDEDLDAVTAILRQVGADLAADEQFAPRLLEPLEVLGLESLDPAQATIRVRVKTLPRRQWEVARELRRRIRRTFQAKGVQMPSPLVAVTYGQGARPFEVHSVDVRPTDARAAP